MPRSGDWLLFHGGALGDLALTVQLALRLSGVHGGSGLLVVSRTGLGRLSGCRPSVRRICPEGLGLHRLYMEGDQVLPERLRELVAGQRVLNALGAEDSLVHRRLLALGAEAVYSFDPRPQPGRRAHITLQWQGQLGRQGLSFSRDGGATSVPTALDVPDELRSAGYDLLEQAWLARGGGEEADGETGRRPDRRWLSRRPWHAAVLVHPGSGGRAKCWPLAGFLEVARRLRRRGVPVVFLIGPVEVERWTTAEIGAVRDGFPLIEAPSPDELVKLLAAAGMLLSNDAGPAHLASLLGTPTVTLFGPTAASVWRPLGERAHAVSGDPRRGWDWGIRPEQVVEVIASGCRCETPLPRGEGPGEGGDSPRRAGVSA